MNRRKFLEQTTQLSVAAGAFVQNTETRATNHVRKSANEKIVIGVIGCNNMGNGIMNHALNQPNVECAAICDIDTNIGNKRADEVMRKQGKRPQLYGDFRKLNQGCQHHHTRAFFVVQHKINHIGHGVFSYWQARNGRISNPHPRKK